MLLCAQILPRDKTFVLQGNVLTGGFAHSVAQAALWPWTHHEFIYSPEWTAVRVTFNHTGLRSAHTPEQQHVTAQKLSHKGLLIVELHRGRVPL